MTNELLFEKLCKLLPAQFEEVVFYTRIPSNDLYNNDTQYNRAKELIEKCNKQNIDLDSILSQIK